MDGLNKHIAREIRRGKFEVAGEQGIYMPESRVFVGGVMDVIHRDRKGEVISHTKDHNMVPEQGRNLILELLFNNMTPIDTWFIAPFGNDYTPANDDTSANVATRAGEIEDYDEPERQSYAPSYPFVSDTASNASSRTTFTFNAAHDVYGAFLISSAVKGGTTGLLLANVRFSAVKPVESAESLGIAYLFAVVEA